jgi:hypothetical protein
MRVLNSRLVTALGVVWPLARHGGEMLYQFEQPFVVDGSKHTRAFGGEATPIPLRHPTHHRLVPRSRLLLSRSALVAPPSAPTNPPTATLAPDKEITRMLAIRTYNPTLRREH